MYQNNSNSLYIYDNLKYNSILSSFICIYYNYFAVLNLIFGCTKGINESQILKSSKDKIVY